MFTRAERAVLKVLRRRRVNGLTLSQVAAALEGEFAYHTVKEHLRVLTQQGMLARHGTRGSYTYTYGRVN